MKSLVKLFVLGIFVSLLGVPALADVTTISGGLVCGNPDCLPGGAVPILQGKTTTLLVKGQDVNFADKNDVDVSGSGVTATITKDYLVAPGEGVGTGAVDVKLTISADAQPGERTVTLNHNGCFGCPKKYRFKILIVRNGKITDVDVPSPSEFFQTADITIQGTRIGNAEVKSTVSGATAQVIENTESRAVVRLSFSTLRAEASGNIQLFDKSCRSCGNSLKALEAFYDFPNGNHFFQVNIIGPNAVKSITPPASVSLGSVFTIRVDLVRPARAGSPFFGREPGLGGPTRLGGETIHWQLAPSHIFEAVSGSGTAFNPTAQLNQVRIPPGDTFVLLTVRLRELPAGCPRQGCFVEVFTRMGNLNSDQPPFFKSASFRVFRP
jgi:hypothetical protein